MCMVVFVFYIEVDFKDFAQFSWTAILRFIVTTLFAVSTSSKSGMATRRQKQKSSDGGVSVYFKRQDRKSQHYINKSPKNERREIQVAI